MTDLFEKALKPSTDYSAKDIEVLEGLEPVRRRPGMYIGGTDERALHHLATEVLDNAMDEAVAGHASKIEIDILDACTIAIRDNGRGIPIDPHPKYPDKSALEVIFTTLHSGAKFSDKIYQTSGGLHGVGISVVNALSEKVTVDVAHGKQVYRQTFSRGHPTSALELLATSTLKRGTSVTFTPDPQIFGDDVAFKPALLFKMVRSKAFLFRGVQIVWRCHASLLKADDKVPLETTLYFPGGIGDYLKETLEGRPCVTEAPFAGQAKFPTTHGHVEWALAWPLDGEGQVLSYCNTILTPQGGTHENGFRGAILKSIRDHGDRIGQKRVSQVTADDCFNEATLVLSAFITNPHFQGQTKEKLVSQEAAKLVESVVKDHFDHWLSDNGDEALLLIEHLIQRADERLKRKQSKDIARAHPTRRLRLPGKLTDCTTESSKGTELFLVEGDAAGGTAKQARNRINQAILPLKGKILNVANATADKAKNNQELSDLILALGCGSGSHFKIDQLRYERIVIMTDADVDGSHIASLLMTFFFREMRSLIEKGHLFLAQPPLFRLTHNGHTIYAHDDAHRENLMKHHFKAGAKVDVGRFKGLGEMNPSQLKETTMDPAKRTLIRVMLAQDVVEGEESADSFVERLMGKKPELRFQFIQDNASFVKELDL